MLIPIGPVKNIPITIVHVVHDPPLLIEGHVVHFDGQAYEVSFTDKGVKLEKGEHLLVDMGDGPVGRRRAQVVETHPERCTLKLLGRARRRERREYPRIEGPLDLEYHLLEPNGRAKLEAWLSHPHLSSADMTWVKPDPYMDFSVTGLRFHTSELPAPGTLMCLRFRIPGYGTLPHTCGGEVIRGEPEDDGFSLAVAFTGLGEETYDALLEYTRHCQDLLLGIGTLHEE